MKKLEITNSMCAITKRAVRDFNSMTNTEFLQKYACSKRTYYRRVKVYGDPYMRAPLARLGKFLQKHF